MLQDAITYGNLVWEVPLEVIVCTSLVWKTIGPSSIAGLVLLLILVPLNGFYVADVTRKLQVGQHQPFIIYLQQPCKLWLSVSLSLSLCLFLCLSVTPPLSLSLSLSPSLSLSLSLSLCLCVSVSLSVALSVSLSLSLSLSEGLV